MRVTHGKPRYSGLFSLFNEYSSLGRTHTPRESAGLERVFVDLGLDRIFVLGREALRRLAVRV